MTGIAQYRTPEDRAELRRILLESGALILSVAALSSAFGGTPPPQLRLLGWGWGLSMLALGAITREHSRQAVIDRVAIIGVLISLGSFFGMVALTGGLASVHLGWLYGFPLALVLFSRGSPPLAVLIVACTAAGALYLDGTSPERRAAPWLATLVSVVAFGGLAALVVRLFRRMRLADSQRDLERERTHSAAQERTRLQAGRLAIVGQLASGVAHEINNPLAFVKANLCYLRSTYQRPEELPPEELEQLLDDTCEGVERIQQIVFDLRSFSRDTSEAAEPCSVRELLEASLRLAHVRFHGIVEPTVALPDASVFVSGNAQRLSQVLVNVLLNAVDAVEETRSERPPRIGVSYRVEDQVVLLEVEDNGPGVSQELRERIFEPFFTTKSARRGTGLGLSISREYLHRYGGRIHLEDPSGGCGTRFSIALVRSAAPAPKSPADAAQGGSAVLAVHRLP